MDLITKIRRNTATLHTAAERSGFIERINEIDSTSPELIIAYAYTIFIADLFGGRTFVVLLSVNYNLAISCELEAKLYLN